ncbi:DUF861 domain-containing protein [candidate division KSB1 bacterium]|nr:DUF861 domain-containing protein [candidate division KSB1 bacterium]
MKIIIEKPSEEFLKEKSVFSWPIWQAEPSTFPWHYDETEICYILEGKAKIKTDDETIEINEGDFVRFPAGLSCTWIILEQVRKHYNFL